MWGSCVCIAFKGDVIQWEIECYQFVTAQTRVVLMVYVD